MWKVEVESDKLNVKNGVSARTGKPYSIREQDAWVYCFDNEGKPHKHPQQVRITLADEQTGPYPVGAYFAHPGSVYVDGKFKQVAIRLRLMPAAEYQAWCARFSRRLALVLSQRRGRPDHESTAFFRSCFGANSGWALSD